MMNNPRLPNYLAVRVAALHIFLGGLLVLSVSCSKKPNDSRTPPLPGTQLVIDQQAAWSPDGSKIIYARDPANFERDTTWEWGGFLHFVDTGKDTCIWPKILFDNFDWSPDGRQIAFVTRAQRYIHDLVTGVTRQITHENRNFSPTWSPCGDKIAYFYKSGDGGMYIYDLELDSIIHFANRNGANSGEWMSNCSTLALIDSCRTSDCGIFTYNVYTDELREISRIEGYKREITVSPDGEAIVFGIHRDLWAVAVSGGVPVQITTEGGAYPDFSPDGQWVVYSKVDWYNGHLWLMRPDGSEKHQITF